MTIPAAPVTLADYHAGPTEPWLAAAADLLAAAAETHPDSGPPRAVPTGDAHLGDLPAGTLTVITTPPGVAATATLFAVAYHAAHRLRLPTLLYPLRCTLTQVAEHLAGAHGEVLDAARQLRDTPLYIGQGAAITVTRIHFDAVDPDIDPPRLIVVDALELLLPAGVARDLKHLALELNVPVLCSATAIANPAHSTNVDYLDWCAVADTVIAA